MFLQITIEVLSAYFATVCFGVLFSIPKSRIWISGFGGAIGWLVYSIGTVNGLSSALCAFLATLCVSTFAETAARILKNPVTIYLVTGILPFVPGAGMYNMMIAAIEKRFSDAASVSLDTLQTAGAIAIGIVIISSITKIITFSKKQSI